MRPKTGLNEVTFAIDDLKAVLLSIPNFKLTWHKVPGEVLWGADSGVRRRVSGVVRRPASTTYLNIFSSKTTEPRVLIFSMQYQPVVFY